MDTASSFFLTFSLSLFLSLSFSAAGVAQRSCSFDVPFAQEGGCFHSRTAVGMFDHVKEAVDKGEVLLEWDYSKVSKHKTK